MFDFSWMFPFSNIINHLSAIERRLMVVETALTNDVIKKVENMVTKLDEAIAEIGETEGKVDQLLTIVTDLREQLEAANTDNNPKVQAVIDRLQAMQDKMTAAGATPAPEPGEGGGGEPVSRSRR